MDNPRMKSLTSRLIFLLLLPLSTNNDIVSAEEGCPELPRKDNTMPFKQMRSYPRGYEFEYTCVDGYVRKSGTVAMTRCEIITPGSPPEWDNLIGSTAFVCIPNPKRKKTTTDSWAATGPRKTAVTTTRTITKGTAETPAPGTPPVMTANIITSKPVNTFKLTSRTLHTFPKRSHSTAQPSASMSSGNYIRKADEMQNTAIHIGVGSGLGAILLIAVTVVGAVMLQRQCRWRSRDLSAPQKEQMPLHPPGIHHPQNLEYRSQADPNE